MFLNIKFIYVNVHNLAPIKNINFSETFSKRTFGFCQNFDIVKWINLKLEYGDMERKKSLKKINVKGHLTLTFDITEMSRHHKP